MERGGNPGVGSADPIDPKKAVEALRRELLLLRKDAGFTPVRLIRAAEVVRLLGGPDQSYDSLRERFVSAIQSLRDPEAELLLDVFSLANDTEGIPLLKLRREIHAGKLGRSIETVAARESAAVEHLRTQLVTGWYPKSPVGMRVPASHNGVIQEFVHVQTFVRDRRWEETREHYRFVAAFDEADYLAISSSFPGRPEPEGDFTVRTKRINDSFTHQFWHHGPMRRGQVYDLRFRLVPDEEYGAPGLLKEESRAFHEPTRTASFEAVFLGERPSRIWAYRGLSYFERPGILTPDRLLTLQRDDRAVARHHDLHGGLYSGIAWNWES